MVFSRWALATVMVVAWLLSVSTAVAAPSFDSSTADPKGDVYVGEKKSTLTGVDLVKTESRVEGDKIRITATTDGDLPADRTEGRNVWYFLAKAFTNPGYKISAYVYLRASPEATLMIEHGEEYKDLPIEFVAQAKGVVLEFDANLIPAGVTCWSILGSVSYTRGNELHMDMPADADPAWKDPCVGGGASSGGGSGPAGKVSSEPTADGGADPAKSPSIGMIAVFVVVGALVFVRRGRM